MFVNVCLDLGFCLFYSSDFTNLYVLVWDFWISGALFWKSNYSLWNALALCFFTAIAFDITSCTAALALN